MTQDDAKKRIAAIEKLQTEFDSRLLTLDKDLYALLLANADSILADPKKLAILLGKFEQQKHVPVLQQFGLDLLTIKSLNDAYFQGAVGETYGGVAVNQVLFENVQRSVDKLYTDRFGITADGEIVSNGLFDLFSKDTTVRRQIQQFAYAQKSSGIGLEKFKRNLKAFIEGAETATDPATPAKGIWSRHYDTVAYDVYQQADRVAQKTFADGLSMTAFVYLGGTIAGTRPFCRVRDGKLFLKSEIQKMGTPADKYGGYQNKSIGYFSGKPKGSYSAQLDGGGVFCRHSWSAISDAQAMRMRSDVKLVNNKLIVIE
ncbi:hypothetical protein [Spirosoma sp. 48-14]|uniref:hypothetical protein n=1 Tax=Spirosoma sp. 48-14 TaxID=1895854 RepID=UPI00096298B2|nr:hypothetical protein [Spirosoma sp. 48-14]OJW75707.1 MAG: hypothetical protein BGO59_09075 [Spirosoma sp. 48-14]